MTRAIVGPKKPQFLDLAGIRFGRLVAVERATLATSSGVMWRCTCDCGKTVVVRTGALRRGATKSCGCLGAELSAKRFLKHGNSRIGKRSAEYGIWRTMKTRCLNPNSPEWSRYGGRGITICDRWNHSFQAFLEDMGPRPSPAHSIDRFPDNDGNYEPSNCRWATSKQQGRNRRSTHMLSWNDETMCATDWAIKLGMRVGTLLMRLQYGWSVEEALTTPVAK